MIQVRDVTKLYDDKKVLNRISFNAEVGNKIALVGFNGTGKTTLIEILAGLITPEKGKVSINEKKVIGFLPQDPEIYNKENVLEYLEDYVGIKDNEEFYRNVEIMFAGFGLHTDIKNKKIGDLSSGQKTKVFLSGVLLRKPDFLLLDEPTNNLDIPGLMWLEDYLKNTKAGFIVVSHDRTFLDKVANKIFEIDWIDRTLEVTNGKYSDYLVQKQKEKARQQLNHTIQKVDLARLTKLGESMQEKAAKGAKHVTPDNDRMLQGYRRDKAGDSLKDSKVIFGRIKRAKIIKKPVSRKGFLIEILPEETENSRDISIKKLVCGYDDGFSIGPIDLDIEFGKSVCIIGLNGEGKSTFLKTITNRVPKISGELRVGEGIKFGNLMQEHENLPKNETLISFMDKNVNQKTTEELQDYLLRFSFTEDQIQTKIFNTSPGARARLLLAYFAATNVNVLVLDEPTNHLDVEAELAIEKTLKSFKGTVVTVTHDRTFLEKVPFDDLYLLEEQKLKKIPNFNEYINRMEKRVKKMLRLLKI